MKEKKKVPVWGSIKQQLNEKSKEELIDLIKKIFDFSSEAQAILQANMVESSDNTTLELFRENIKKNFITNRGFSKNMLTDSKRMVQEYSKTTRNTIGIIDLLLTFIECGTEYTVVNGDINEPFYDSLETAFEEMSNMIRICGVDTYRLFSNRIKALAEHADQIGWGYGDFLVEEIALLKKEF
jgi:hypothetical protein